MPTSRRAPCRGPRWLSAGRGGRETRRVAVPQDLVAALRFGSDNVDELGPEFWGLLKERMEELIEAQLPDGALGVRAILDEVHTEVVVSYRLDGWPPACPGKPLDSPSCPPGGTWVRSGSSKSRFHVESGGGAALPPRRAPAAPLAPEVP